MSVVSGAGRLVVKVTVRGAARVVTAPPVTVPVTVRVSGEPA